MTDEQRAREVACDALVACCKLPSDTPVDQYHHEPECDALTAAILTLMQQARREEREAWAAQMKSMAAPKLEDWGVLHTTEREDG